MPPGPAAHSAKTLILIGLILQVVETAVILSFGFLFIFFSVLALFVLPIAFIMIIWLVCVYLFSYRRTSDGNYEGAQAPTLVFGILSLMTLSIVSGILYLIAYSELGTALNQAYRPQEFWGAPPSNPGMRYCSHCGRMNAPYHSFCEACGARLS
ncbi:MAG: zinc-ribbon domain-containing protein [Thermoplasmata archaeon]|nr:zinc-ribbon domain-containing protein [Thermoplasmata archaeon]